MISTGQSSNLPTGDRRRRLGRMLPALAGAVVLVWLASGFYTVGTDERGVVLRFGRVHDKGIESGLHYTWPRPIERAYTPRISDVKSLEVGFATLGQKSSEARRSDTLTGDENILKIMMVVQYQIRDPVAYLFRAEEPHWLVERTVESAMIRLVASLSVDDVLTTAKDEIQVKAIALAQGWLDAYQAGITLLGGNLQVVDPPVPVSPAFKEVASAKKDAERMLDEAREYEGRILPEARGQAQRLLSEAQARATERINRARGDTDWFLSLLAEYRQAKAVTRTRLYVETMERVLAKMKVVILDRREGPGASKITIVDR
ncbi:MAG: FtsH protease activity modulator HflK [Planctomycetota bacterium]